MATYRPSITYHPIHPASNGELLTVDLTSYSCRGHSHVLLPDSYIDRRTDGRSATPSPVSSLPAPLTRPLISRDTVLYLLPPMANSYSREVLYDQLWRAWYPVRPTGLRVLNDSVSRKKPREDDTTAAWEAGERFCVLPARVGEHRDDQPGELGREAMESLMGQLAEFHVLLARRVAECEDEVNRSKFPRAYRLRLGEAFPRAFVVADQPPVREGEEDEGQDGGRGRAKDLEILLALRRDGLSALRDIEDVEELMAPLTLEARFAELNVSSAGKGGGELEEENWDVWRVPLNVAVRIIAGLDDPERLYDEAPLSEYFVARFFDGGNRFDDAWWESLRSVLNYDSGERTWSSW